MRWPDRITYSIILLFALSFTVLAKTESMVPPLVCKNTPPAEDDKQWLLYEDDTVKMVAVGYGDVTKQSNPGFYIFRKAMKDGIRIDKVSTRGATFGRSPTYQEVKDAGKIPPSIGWDFRHLAVRKQVNVPLTSAGFLFFPDKIERYEKKNEYELRFNSSWKIAGVETILKLQIDELIKRDCEQGTDKDTVSRTP
jgi:hypothetical protein